MVQTREQGPSSVCAKFFHLNLNIFVTEEPTLGSLQKELAQSDQLGLRKCPKCEKLLLNSECQLKRHIFDVISAVCARIELILCVEYQNTLFR